MSKIEEEAKKAFPCEIRLISTTRDSQIPLTAFDGGLPNPLQKTGGSCTSAFLLAAYSTNNSYPSWLSMLDSMNQVLEGRGLDQNAQLQSSRHLDMSTPMTIVPPDMTGKKRALLIGINYSGQEGQLPSCHDDVFRMQEFIMQREDFDESNITILMDRKGHPYYPTRKNILTCFRRLVTQSKAGDVAFVHFVGTLMFVVSISSTL